MAKGAWRPKKTTGPLLEPMNHIHLQYYHKNSRDIQILKDVELIHQFSILRSKLDRIILGQTVVEALDKSTPASNSFPILYRLGWRVLDKMNHADVNFWLVFIFYLYQLVLISFHWVLLDKYKTLFCKGAFCCPVPQTALS